MARGHAVDSARGSTTSLSPLETAERIAAFLDRWRREGGPVIDIDAVIEDVDADAGGESVPASVLLPEIPAWLSSAGAIVPRDHHCVLLWLNADPREKTLGSLQLLFRRPRQWTCPSVKIHYYVIRPCSGEGKNVLLSGVEQCRGERVLLSLPAAGEMLIRICESY